jgi:hypothetical protein
VDKNFKHLIAVSELVQHNEPQVELSMIKTTGKGSVTVKM